MASTTFMLECEDWVRVKWMAERFGQAFYRERLRLSSGGLFDFDAVSADRRMAATISTSGALTASGKRGAGKLFKIRSDVLFLLLAEGVSRRMVLLTETDMYELCMKERAAGRMPQSIEFLHVQLPAGLCQRLTAARRASSVEVSPRDSNSADESATRNGLDKEIADATPRGEALAKLAEAHRPPPSWWQENVDPFQPERGD